MRAVVAIAFFLWSLATGAAAQTPPPQVGIVVMHGKGGAPTKLVAGLANWLSKEGYRVANLEMPWSGARDYDTTVEAADREVDAAIAKLREQGATKIIVCGHSLGGWFGLHYAGQRPFDGLVAIAPGGDPGTKFIRRELGPSVERARGLVADGKGGERTRLDDYENARGLYPITTTPANYLSWFAPDGPMSQAAIFSSVRPGIPVLYIAPTGDYPGLRQVKDAQFARLPRHPATRLYEPAASHTSAPWDSHEEIARWIGEVAR